MICKVCAYFKYDENGQLVCSVCGKPAHKSEVEDKLEHTKIETKPKTKIRTK